MSFGPTQIDQKSRKNVAWTMWNRIDAVSRMPAIQCHCTHANRTPTIGRNAVNSSASIENAITQWNIRATKPWRGMRAGRPARSLPCDRLRLAALAVLREQHVAAVREQEQQPADQRRPEQVPRDVDEYRLAPWAERIRSRRCHSASPRIARFTSALTSGIL